LLTAEDDTYLTSFGMVDVAMWRFVGTILLVLCLAVEWPLKYEINVLNKGAQS